jgi:hypothetical protein
VRLLADLILTRLSFRSLAAHLEPVAAAFGAGASAACVVDVAPEGTEITCVEEGIVLPDGCARLAAGGDALTRTLLALLRAHGGWPAPLAGLGAAAAAGGGLVGACSPYDLDLLTQLRDSRCYCVKVGAGCRVEMGVKMMCDGGVCVACVRAWMCVRVGVVLLMHACACLCVDVKAACMRQQCARMCHVYVLPCGSHEIGLCALGFQANGGLGG